MRAAVIALLLLAACGPKAEDAGLMPVDGLLVLVHDGVRVPVTGSTDGVMPAAGSLWLIDEAGASSRGIDIAADQVEVIGVSAEPLDLNTRVPLTRLRINTALLAGDTLVQGADYDLGPDGGEIWITAIETKADGIFRVRGQFDGRICPAPDATSDCHRIEGVFAFDQAEIRPNTMISDLVAPAEASQ